MRKKFENKGTTLVVGDLVVTLFVEGLTSLITITFDKEVLEMYAKIISRNILRCPKMVGSGGLRMMRQFDIEAANKWLTENWDAIKASQYIECIKRCIEKEKATSAN